mmetsp:Transcript_98837/g.176055  ORF Transcript_98837/g.176055 Transcript_98837/m.176055 type:complete len:148 (+) Transcript_98837:83-526(+)|eukprot:CAMPEP_0197663174 /NCGR_PEP_ID=MMETSP1338-20131121/56393_1 /TAXON_ID=43686 ORGANISM="Pelagodinium beii, Strain RCC1491" /NCGR_SAMPLE_ID=MMETSP1338 /ASSEMBLY_ACC=CAM_ASM_000754 /LENGTH=147 /DNA_ID=CAMNT_0043241413 /DNA_START=59 /DNA_END=502 /DNA_ORIENTATION=-
MSDLSFKHVDGIGDGYNNHDVSIKVEPLTGPLETCSPIPGSESDRDGLKQGKVKMMDSGELLKKILRDPVLKADAEWKGKTEEEDAEVKEKIETLLLGQAPQLKTITHTRHSSTTNKEIDDTVIYAEIPGPTSPYLLTYAFGHEVRD